MFNLEHVENLKRLQKRLRAALANWSAIGIMEGMHEDFN